MVNEERVVVRHSPIHGRGIFAARRIEVGEVVITAVQWRPAARRCAFIVGEMPATKLSLLIATSWRTASAAAGTAATCRLRAALTGARLAAERTGAEAVVLRAAPRTDNTAIEIRRERPFFGAFAGRSEEHTSELQSQSNLVC